MHADSSTAVLMEGHITVHPCSRVDCYSRPRTKEARQGGPMQVAFFMWGSLMSSQLIS
jgi:hypothetical protein